MRTRLNVRGNIFTDFQRKKSNVSGIVCTIHGIAVGIVQ